MTLNSENIPKSGNFQFRRFDSPETVPTIGHAMSTIHHRISQWNPHGSEIEQCSREKRHALCFTLRYRAAAG